MSNAKPIPFDQWKGEFDKILMERYCVSYEEIMHDEELEKRFYEGNESDPSAGVQEYADKWCLMSTEKAMRMYKNGSLKIPGYF